MSAFAYTPPGTIWKTRRGTTPNGILAPANTAATTPGPCDICTFVSGKMNRQITSTSTGSTLVITAIMAGGRNPNNEIYNPGVTAATNGNPVRATFGGRASRFPVLPASSVLMYFVPISDEDEWVMSIKAGATGTIGNSNILSTYGLDFTSSQWTVDPDNANAAVRVTGLYEPDVSAGLTVPRVWVTAVSPNGGSFI